MEGTQRGSQLGGGCSGLAALMPSHDQGKGSRDGSRVEGVTGDSRPSALFLHQEEAVQC